MAEKRLTKEIAEQFLADDTSVDLRDFTVIDDEAAKILWVYDRERLPQPISVADRLACPAVSPVRLIGVPFLAQSAAAASGTR